jgi:hypothetical protein
MYCYVKKQDKSIDYAHRHINGDIRVRTYCTLQLKEDGKYRKITHSECGSSEVIYKNGEGYSLSKSIVYNDRFKNLIGCWCNENLRFQNEEELLKHVEGKTHPEEFEN